MRIWNFSSEVWILRILILLASNGRWVHRLFATWRIDAVDLLDVNIVEGRSIIIVITLRGIRFARLRMLLIRNFLHRVYNNHLVVFFVWVEIFRGLLSLYPSRFVRRSSVSILTNSFTGWGLLRAMLLYISWLLKFLKLL
jgi:hypothetical protein